jgi:hypothetical protein
MNKPCTQSSRQSLVAGHMTVMLTGSKKCRVAKRATVQRDLPQERK